MEQKTFSRSGLTVFSRNPLRLGRGGSQHYHDFIKIKPLIGAYLYKVMMLYRDKLLFLT